MSRNRILGGLAVIMLVAIGWFLFQRQQAAQEARSVGIEVSRTITASFAGMNALKVGTVSGDVLSSSSTTTFFGTMPVIQRSRAPYSVDYFVDLSKLSAASYRWNAATRTMSVEVPDVTIAAPNIDGAKAAIVQQGVYISRRAGITLQQQAAERANAAVRKTAQDPKHLAQARANARAAIAKLATAPLKAAGLYTVKVVVRFAGEGDGQREVVDGSTALSEIMSR